MAVLSRAGVAASILDHAVKLFARALMAVNVLAAAGSAQTDATALTAGKNIVTGADDAKGVILPVAEVDMEVRVLNTVSNKTLLVYPNSGAAINAIAADGAFSVLAGTEAVFYCDGALHWYVRAAGTLTGVATSASTAQLNAAAVPASGTRTSTTTDAVSAADHNLTVYIDNATGFVTTLPAPAAGLHLNFILKTANTSGNHTIVSATSANIIKGLQNSVAGDAGDFGTADDTISFVANSALPGDRVELFSDGTSWFAYATSKLAASITFTQAS